MSVSTNVFDGAVMIVSGAGGNFGRAGALRFAAEGANLVLETPKCSHKFYF